MKLAVVLALVAAACSIDHPSDQFACDTSADCTGERACVGGFCVTDEGPPGNGCPSQCTTCDLAAKTCGISGDREVTCPDGFHCTIACGSEDCRNVDCTGAASCTIQCTGKSSCEQVECGSGPCEVTCSGESSCQQVDCRASCACGVTCSGPGSCDSAACPTSCAIGLGCTTAEGCTRC